jgi:hypothetical protein
MGKSQSENDGWIGNPRNLEKKKDIGKKGVRDGEVSEGTQEGRRSWTSSKKTEKKNREMKIKRMIVFVLIGNTLRYSCFNERDESPSEITSRRTVGTHLRSNRAPGGHHRTNANVQIFDKTLICRRSHAIPWMRIQYLRWENSCPER